MNDPLSTIQLAVTLTLVGIIWFVQVVHYPLFALVGREHFARYHRAHGRFTTMVVAPLMLVEAAAAIGGMMLAPMRLSPAVSVTALALLLVVWLSTFGLQVPMHRRLAGGFDAAAHRRLVTTNWVRTCAWTARAVLLVAAAAR
jgi:hypothetical protein